MLDRLASWRPFVAGIAIVAALSSGTVIAGDRFARSPAHAAGCTGASGGAAGPGAMGPGCGGARHHGWRDHCAAGSCDQGCGHCGGHGCGLCGPGSCKYDAWEKRYFLRAQGKSWHSAWYDPAEGRPIALVVPPTSEFMTQYSWGVPSSRVMPIYHQFRRPYPGAGAVAGSGGGFLPTPYQPSDTVQFGVNAVRGPWGSY